MAQRTMTVCDVEDAADIAVAASARVQLHLDGEVHNLDLCTAHLEELRAAVASVLPGDPSAGRRGRTRHVGRTPTPAARRSPTRRPRAAKPRTGGNPLAYSDAVRQWARDNGLAVKDRGRISQAVLDRYLARSEESTEAGDLPAE